MPDVTGELARYAELLNLKENSLINESAYGSWTAPHGGAVYCAAPITVEGSDGTGRVDLFAVGYDCCGGSDEIVPPAYLNSTRNATDNSTVTTLDERFDIEPFSDFSAK